MSKPRLKSDPPVAKYKRRKQFEKQQLKDKALATKESLPKMDEYEVLQKAAEIRSLQKEETQKVEVKISNLKMMFLKKSLEDLINKIESGQIVPKLEKNLDDLKRNLKARLCTIFAIAKCGVIGQYRSLSSAFFYR